MEFNKANVVDILRCNQRDEQIVNTLQDEIHSFIKLFESRNYHRLRKDIPAVANVWYYLLTSVNNLQTLGEEYAGVIRINKENKLPGQALQLSWLILYVGGEALFDKLLKALSLKISKSKTLSQQAKRDIPRIIDFILEHKQTLRKIHHSLFYIDGKYYNICNRSTSIKYVLLRKWFKDDSFTQTFRLLGNVSLFYILYSFIEELWIKSKSDKPKRNTTVDGYSDNESTNKSTKICIICSEVRSNAAVTPCGHIFCWNCIFDSLTYQNSCPLCRENVPPNRVVLLQNYP